HSRPSDPPPPPPFPTRRSSDLAFGDADDDATAGRRNFAAPDRARRIQAYPVAGHTGPHTTVRQASVSRDVECSQRARERLGDDQDRKSTRLNSSHVSISYAVFC